MRKFSMILLLFVGLAAVFFTLRNPIYAAEQPCISEILIEEGSRAVGKLEKNGYTAIYRNLNPSGAGERLYLGYKFGDSAITGLITASEAKEQIVSGSVVYSLVSEVNLNKGAGGTPVYLYYTRDPKAGSGIVSLNMLLKDPMNDAEPIDLMNDGSIPLRTVDGRAADLEEGIADYSLYLFMVPKNLCLPYISELRVVTVKDQAKLFEAVVSSGCDYYQEEGIASSSEGSSWLCYNRTADEDKAIRYAAVSDDEILGGIPFVRAGSYQDGENKAELIYTKSAEVGSPVTDITVGEKMGEDFTLGEWAQAYFGGEITSAKARLFRSEEYNALIASEEPFAQFPVRIYEEGAETGTTKLFLVQAEGAMPLDLQEAESDAPATETEENGEDETPESKEETEFEETIETEEEPGIPEFEETAEFENEDENVIAENEEEVLPDEEVIEEADDLLLSDGQEHDTVEEGFIREDETGPEEDSAGQEEIDEAPGSVIGTGSLIAITVMTILAVILVFIVVIIRGRKSEDKE